MPKFLSIVKMYTLKILWVCVWVGDGGWYDISPCTWRCVQCQVALRQGTLFSMYSMHGPQCKALQCTVYNSQFTIYPINVWTNLTPYHTVETTFISCILLWLLRCSHICSATADLYRSSDLQDKKTKKKTVLLLTEDNPKIQTKALLPIDIVQ